MFRTGLFLKVLNLFRWSREFVVVWATLSIVYSLTVALLLQPALEWTLNQEVPFRLLWACVGILLLIPALLEALPLGGFSFRAGPAVFMPSGVFGGKFAIYLRHDLRRGATWLTVLVVVWVGSLIPEGKEVLWVLITQLSVQRALFSVHRWRILALNFKPGSGAGLLLSAIRFSQLSQLLVAGVAWIALRPMPLEQWGLLMLASGAGVVASSAVAFEGDSGRPWIVNFVALAVGVLSGFLTYAFPLSLIFVVYFAEKMRSVVEGRLYSVEHMDEDALIS